MHEERFIVKVQKDPELYGPQSRHYKDNVRIDIAWRAVALEIGSLGEQSFLNSEFPHMILR